MAEKRINQVNSLIAKEIGELFLKEIEWPPGCLVTVSKVETSRDLGAAKVFISIIPDDKQNEILAKINQKTSKLQFLLNKKLVMRQVPRLVFEVDQSLQKAERINRLLDNLKDNR